jgi:hypothetical protein
VLVVLSAFLFHALFGRSTRGLVITIVVALTGFVLGEMIARLLGHTFAAMGPLHMVHGLLGTWVAMSVARYLSA